MLSWANQLFRSLAIKNIEIETEILQNERRLWDGRTVYLIYVTSSQWAMFDDSSLPTSQYPNNTNSTVPGHPGCYLVLPPLSERADVLYFSSSSHTTSPISLT